MSLEAGLKARANELGLIACGIARAAPTPTDRLESWLASGHGAAMSSWLGRSDALAARGDVRVLLPGARSVIVVAQAYRTDEPWDENRLGRVARYARGGDYHDGLKERLEALLCWLRERAPCEGKVCVDSSPVQEREWARRAGLGWIGKNTLVLSREWGSYVLLGELIVDLELEADAPHVAQFCGSCTRCLDACPTSAFPEAGVLDANLCISYHTIENRRLAPHAVRERFEDWIFGCDVCQEVCPWNERAIRRGVGAAEPHLWTRPEFPALDEWIGLEQSEFSARLRHSPLKRAKRRGMKRNAARALINRRQSTRARHLRLVQRAPRR